MSRVVVVTGASAGIGRAIAVAFARSGARLGLIARDSEALAETLAEVEAVGGDGLVLPADVTDYDRLASIAERIERELGPIDIWVNNAMVTVFGQVWDIAPEEFRRVTEVTYLGFVHGTLAALKYMRRRDLGTIIQISSALAYRAIPLQSAYCAAKHAIKGFSQSLRCELLHENSNIYVVMVDLPGVNTPQFDWSRNKMSHKSQPLPPIFEPEVAARAVTWVADHPRREMIVGGPALMAVLGERVSPGLMDLYMARKAYGGQLADQSESHDRPDNLFQPVSDLHRMRGRFSARAKGYSVEAWAARRKTPLLLGIGGAALAMAAGIAYSNRKSGANRKSGRKTLSLP